MHQSAQQIQMPKQAYARGDYKRAIQLCNQSLSRLGARDDLLNIRAVSYLALGEVEAAERSIQQALKLNPRIAGVHLNAAKIFEAQSQNKKVKRHAMDAIRLAPRDALVLYQAALLYRNCGDYKQASRVLDRCLQLEPGFSQAWHLKGSALIDLGEMEAAQTALEKSVELTPGNIKALASLINIRGDRLSDTETVLQLERIKLNGAVSADRASATFALAKMHHDNGQYDVAFSLYLEANALGALSNPFDPDDWEQKKKDVMQASSLPGALTGSQGHGGEKLVFIVGMPRSGTTLCEQVLSANTAVLDCGELTIMERVDISFSQRGIDPYQAAVSLKELSQVADLYLSALPKNHSEYQRITDKAPMNFERVGMIHKVFPKARFLYCIRHPLDTIFSCFMQDFQSGLIFAANLEHITRVYIAHIRMMRHWMSLLPGQIHIVNYEKFVENQDSETHRLADFLEIPFEQDMLSPHLQERAVVTASTLQVRQAVDSSSIGRWKHYRSQLSEMVLLLQEAELLDADLNSLCFPE